MKTCEGRFKNDSNQNVLLVESGVWLNLPVSSPDNDWIKYVSNIAK